MDSHEQSTKILLNCTLDLIEDALECLRADEKVTGYKEATPPVLFARDFKTVRIGGRRQMGHSTVIDRLTISSQYSTMTVIPEHKHLHCHNYDPERYWRKRNLFSADGCIVPIKDLDPLHVRGSMPFVPKMFRGRPEEQCKVDLCLVDMTSWIKEKDLDMMYHVLCPHVDLFVLFQ